MASPTAAAAEPAADQWYWSWLIVCEADTRVEVHKITLQTDHGGARALELEGSAARVRYAEHVPGQYTWPAMRACPLTTQG